MLSVFSLNMYIWVSTVTHVTTPINSFTVSLCDVLKLSFLLLSSGSPGSGVEDQCKRLAEKYTGFVHFTVDEVGKQRETISCYTLTLPLNTLTYSTACDPQFAYHGKGMEPASVSCLWNCYDFCKCLLMPCFASSPSGDSSRDLTLGVTAPAAEARHSWHLAGVLPSEPGTAGGLQQICELLVDSMAQQKYLVAFKVISLKANIENTYRWIWEMRALYCSWLVDKMLGMHQLDETSWCVSCWRRAELAGQTFEELHNGG